MIKIKEGDKGEKLAYNQVVRWVNNKEAHSGKIQFIAAQYFLTQRIKLPNSQNPKEVAAYYHQLGLLHQLIFYAMKAKQTTDTQFVQKLTQTIGNFEKSYFSTHTH